jgi:hypothetical protein
MNRKHYSTALATGLPAAFAPGTASACVGCGLDESGYIWSFLFMTGVPLALVSVIGGYFYFSYRRKNKLSEPPSGAPPIHLREKAN